MPEKWVLRQYQSLPLRAKIGMTENRIIEWYEHFAGDVCVSFSGGKDSTVLADLVHKYYPHVPLVFANTGLEYPEIQAFAKKMGAMFVRPKMRFDEVISTYGYPIIGKENAEAIYYARRIRNSGGGATRTDKQSASLRTSWMETCELNKYTTGYKAVQKRRKNAEERKAGVNGKLASSNMGGGVRRARKETN